MAREIKANTQVVVTIGPFVDVGDGFTPETGVTLSGADEAEILKHGATAVTDISGATWAAITGADGHYSLTLTTSLTDTPGNLVVIVQDDSVCLPLSTPFNVLSEFEWDRKYGTEGAAGGRLSGVVSYGTAQGATATSLQLAAGANVGEIVGAVVFIRSATAGAGQSRFITDYVAATDTVTVDTWTPTPTGTIEYVIFAAPPANATNVPPVNVTQWNGSAVATPNVAGVPKTDVTHVSGVAEDLPTATAVAAVKSDTAAVLADTGTDGVVIANGGITAAKFAANAIAAAGIADGALTPAKHGDITAPAAAPTFTGGVNLAEAVGFLLALAKQKQTLTLATGAVAVRNEADTASIATGTDASDGTTVTKGALA